MPYIKQEDRQRLLPLLQEMEDIYPKTSGELNYFITCVILDYFKRNGGRYEQINDVLGALEGAKLEFYRRRVGPYEDLKLKENGDVY